MYKEISGNKKLSGTISIPSSKSHTIRAILIASLANGKSIIKNPLISKDTLSCIECCKNFGAKIKFDNKKIEIEGVNKNLDFTTNFIDTENSGTTLFFIATIISLQSKEILLTGDHSIQNRKIAPLLNALKELGANINYLDKNGYPPVKISGPIKSGKITIDCPTSQYLSSLLIGLPLAKGDFSVSTDLLLEKPYVDITLDWLKKQSININYDKSYKKFFICGDQFYKCFKMAIPADFSSAAFFLVGAAISTNKIIFKNLDIFDAQGDKAIIDILKNAGAKISINKKHITVSGKILVGQKIDMTNIPDLLPILSVFGCFASGETTLYNISHIREKECDRVAVMTKELKKMGANISEEQNKMVIKKSQLTGTILKGHKDHRVVMALSIAATMAIGNSKISDHLFTDITFPGFFDILNSITN